MEKTAYMTKDGFVKTSLGFFTPEFLEACRVTDPYGIWEKVEQEIPDNIFKIICKQKVVI